MRTKFRLASLLSAQYMVLVILSRVSGPTEYMTDGNLIPIVILAAIRECKNEPGDHLSQATLLYANFLTKALESPHHFYNFNTRFPFILLVDMGPYVGFYGAVWDGLCARVQPLTPLLDLTTRWREIKAREAL